MSMRGLDMSTATLTGQRRYISRQAHKAPGRFPPVVRFRIAYRKRADGIIQRYRTKAPKLVGESTKKEYLAQRKLAKARRSAYQKERRRLAKQLIPAPDRPNAAGRAAPPDLPPVPERFKNRFTIFKAAGSSNPRAGGRRRDPFFASDPTTVSQPPPGMISGPFAFYSNQGIGLGRVKFDGQVPVETLIARLNKNLYIFDRKGRGPIDFRAAYPRWEYTYFVIEQVLGGGDRIIARDFQANDSKGRGRK